MSNKNTIATIDGNEAAVLMGAKSIIQNSKPQMMLELAPYVYRKNPNGFDEFLESLWREGYEMSDVVTRRPFPNNPIQVRGLIPEAGGVNVLATYKG